MVWGLMCGRAGRRGEGCVVGKSLKPRTSRTDTNEEGGWRAWEQVAYPSTIRFASWSPSPRCGAEKWGYVSRGCEHLDVRRWWVDLSFAPSVLIGLAPMRPPSPSSTGKELGRRVSGGQEGAEFMGGFGRAELMVALVEYGEGFGGAAELMVDEGHRVLVLGVVVEAQAV